MSEFASGESKTAVAPITVKPSGLSCETELFLGPDDMTKVATSGRIPFVSTGVSQAVHLPVVMPTAEGTYHVYLDLYVEGILIGVYQAIEDVVIVPVLEFPHLNILRVEGVPFSGVGVEPKGTLFDFLQVLNMYSCANWPIAWCLTPGQPEAIAECVGGAIYSSQSELIAVLATCLEQAGVPYPSYPQGGGYVTYASSIASHWSCDEARQEVPVAYLAEPITMSTLRGISLTWVNKTIPWQQTPGIVYTMWWMLSYKPQFLAPMYGPGFRCLGVPVPPGEPCTVPITELWAQGYSYPGIYDGAVTLVITIDSYGQGLGAYFRIKNLAEIKPG